MASSSMASSSGIHFYSPKTYTRNHRSSLASHTRLSILPRNNKKNPQDDQLPSEPTPSKSGREIILRSSEVAVLGSIFQFSGRKPDYLGVQKSPPGLALCPATKNCVSTSENISDLTHYAPPWNYNPEEGRGVQNPVTQQQAMDELIQVIRSTKPDNYAPRIAEKKDDYIRVEYESPILGFVDDVEFWFPPGKKSIVQYRSASRLGNFDFDINRKRIKALRQALEKKGWASEISL